MAVAEDAEAGADDAGRLPLDEDPERLAIAAQDGLDRASRLVVGRDAGGRLGVEGCLALVLDRSGLA